MFRFFNASLRKTPVHTTKRKGAFRPLVECMEDRSTPSVTLPTAGTPGPVTITGTSAADAFVIRLQPGTPANIQFSDNGGASFQTAALADVSSVEISGLAGNDSLTVDNSNGLVAQAPNSAMQTTNLVSDQPGVAQITDPNLQNAWGIAVNPGGTIWVSSNHHDVSTVYTGDHNGAPLAKSTLVVSIPQGSPTGQVFNASNDFVVSGNGASGPAKFIFASEAGVVSGWNPNVPGGVQPPSTVAEQMFTATDGAIYKGIALGNNGVSNHLYVTDFHNGKIDVLDNQFNKVALAGNFTDPNLPAGYAPFGIATINGKLYVSYAVQDADAEDDVQGAGLGFIDVFDMNGNFQQRLVTTGGNLNAPWGMAQAPAGFGTFAGDLLVGNFGDGHINAYDPTTGAFKGQLTRADGAAVQIEGLWGLAFGAGTAGDPNSLYFSAGPDDETHGLFGKITLDGTNTVGLPIRFDGGAGVDTAKVVGDPRTLVNESFTPTDGNSGSLALTNGAGTIAATLELTGVASVVDTGTASALDIHVPDTTRIVDIVQGAKVGNDTTIKVRGPQAAALGSNITENGDSGDDEVQDDASFGLDPSRGMLSISFANKRSVTISADANSNTGQLFILNAKKASEGLQDLTINGGGGTDAIVQPHQPDGVDITLRSIERSRGDANSALVDTLYAFRLGRLPSATEEAAWLAVMQAKGQSAVAQGISQSAEAEGQLVRQWYDHFLGRNASDDEAAAWVAVMQGGASAEQTMAGIVGSAEFFARAQAKFNTGDANRNLAAMAYQVALGRTGSAAELDGWVTAVPRIGTAGMAAGFVGSAEFRDGVVRTYYSVLLGRGADDAGLNNWVSSGQSLGTIRESFESSDEFFGEGQ